MKELAEDFKVIWKKDKSLFWWITIQFLCATILFVISIVNLNPNHAKFYASYSDIGLKDGVIVRGGYSSNYWWYLLSFSIMAFVFGIGHSLLSVKIHSKRGKDIARLFLGISIGITIIAIRFLLSILGEG